MSDAFQRGVALITALLVVALATTAAVSMVTRQQLDMRRTGNLLHSEQAWMYALGAESWAKAVLARDAKDTIVDTLSEDWATQLPASLVEGGSVLGRVIDLQSRFNLNNVYSKGVANEKGTVNEEALKQYKRLLRVLGIDEELADPLVDWIDENIETRFPGGAEDDTYLGKRPAYRAANRPLNDATELGLIQGYTPEILAKLLPHVIALPESTALNLNTASATVLRSLADNMSDTDGAALVEARGKNGFESADKFLQEPALAGMTINPSSISVQSKWFLLISEARIGQARARLATVIQRNEGKTLVIGRKRTFIEPITVAKPTT